MSTSINFFISSGTGSTYQHLIYLLYFSNCLNHSILFLIYQYLTDQLLILTQPNHHFQQIAMYRHLLRFISQILLDNYTKLVQLPFCFYYDQKTENNSFFYIMLFFVNATNKRFVITFPFDIQFITISFNYFFYSTFSLICFLESLLIKTFYDFFNIKIANNICPRDGAFNFCNHKTSFRPNCKVNFSKNVSRF